MAIAPENDLERALLRAQDDVLARPDFYRCLMNEPVFVPGEIATGAGGGMNIAVVRHNGRDFHPVFTSLARLKAAAGNDERHFAIPGREFFSRTQGADFLLNPRSELGKVLLANEIAFWLDPSARARRNLMRSPPRAVLTVPKELPRILPQALRLYFANRRQVTAAYVLEVALSDRAEPPHPLIVVDTEDDWPKIAAEVSELMAALLPDLIVDLVRRDVEDTAVSSHLKATAPVYLRETLPT